MNDNNTAVKKALSDIVASYGVEVLTDINRTNALLKDFIPRYDKERKLIVLTLREGMGAELQNYASFGNENWKQIMTKWEKRLVSDNWIAKEAAHLVVSQLVEAVGMSVVETPIPNSEHSQAETTGFAEITKGEHRENENPSDYLPAYQIIGYKAFASNLLLETIRISDTIKIIRAKAFFNCVNLKKIEISSSIEEIGRKAFMGCSSLKEILIPRAKKYASREGLLINTENHTLLRAANTDARLRIAIPDDIQALQEYAFDESKAKQIILPKNLSTIESSAFYRCFSLESYEISSANQHFCCIEGVIHSKDGKKLLTYPAGSSRSSYILEDDVKEIARNAFSCAINLESITFPSGLLLIGEKAFSECRKIRSIVLPITVQSIGERAFQGCTHLEHIMLPRGIEEIGDFAFSGCESLETLSIPRGVIRIGNRAFNGCKNLKRVVIQDKVSFIGDGAFDDCMKDIEIAVSNNPYVETYCRSRGLDTSKI